LPSGFDKIRRALTVATQLIRSRAAAIDVLEAAHASSASVQIWLEGIARTLDAMLDTPPNTPGGVALMVLKKVDGQYDLLKSEGDAKGAWRVPWSTNGYPPQAHDWVGADPRVLDAFHQSAIVDTRCNVAEGLAPGLEDPSGPLLKLVGMKDALGMNAPAGNLLLNASALWPEPIKLGHAERLLLSQITLHLAAGLALLQATSREVAVIDTRGRMVHATGALRERAVAEPLVRHVGAVERSRSRRRRSDPRSLQDWEALVGGQWGLVECTAQSGARYYAVLETPRNVRKVRALTELETKVLQLSARGAPGKLVGYALGISAGHVSRALQSCAMKVGVRSRTEIVRVGAALLGQHSPPVSALQLTEAEREVLELVRQGLTNAEIAGRRNSSPQTVANQVAALLAKMQAPTRRALATLG